MEAKELRLGNWVIISGLIGETDYIKIPSGKYIDNNHASAKPIPLTPEILEKAGFVTLSDTYSKRLDPCSYIEVHNTFNQIWIEAGGGYCIPIEHIKHLHQLQNLYFALTGEELEINLH